MFSHVFLYRSIFSLFCKLCGCEICYFIRWVECVYVYVYVCVYIYIYIYMCVCVYMYIEGGGALRRKCRGKYCNFKWKKLQAVVTRT